MIPDSLFWEYGGMPILNSVCSELSPLVAAKAYLKQRDDGALAASRSLLSGQLLVPEFLIMSHSTTSTEQARLLLVLGAQGFLPQPLSNIPLNYMYYYVLGTLATCYNYYY
jgi:hypothetical protein